MNFLTNKQKKFSWDSVPLIQPVSQLDAQDCLDFEKNFQKNSTSSLKDFPSKEDSVFAHSRHPQNSQKRIAVLHTSHTCYKDPGNRIYRGDGLNIEWDLLNGPFTGLQLKVTKPTASDEMLVSLTTEQLYQYKHLKKLETQLQLMLSKLTSKIRLDIQYVCKCLLF